MKRILLLIVSFILILSLFACGNSDSFKETNAKSILNSVQAIILPGDEQVDVVIEKIEHLKTQMAHNNEYDYYLIKTDYHDWGYAEFRNGDVITYYVGFSKSDAKTRCKDTAEFRISKLGGMYQ